MKEYPSCGHSRRNVHDRRVAVPGLVSRQNPNDRPDCLDASLESAISSRWSCRGDEQRCQILVGTDAPARRKSGARAASRATALHSQTLCGYEKYHAVPACCYGAQAYTWSYTCRLLRKVLPPHACIACRRVRYNAPFSRMLPCEL